MKEIQLHGKYSLGKVILIDDDDYEWASKIHWIFDGKYARNSKKERIHRLIMNPPIGMGVDHINGNGLDNRKENLRVCTSRQNNWNRLRRKGTNSGYIGVRLLQGKYIQAYIKDENKQRCLGCFDTYEEAARAYDEAAKKTRGEFAVLNFPD